jgi:multiple sugar transport system substrate-binding protein
MSRDGDNGTGNRVASLINRRKFLTTAGATGVVALAGCGGDGNGNGSNGNGNGGNGNGNGNGGNGGNTGNGNGGVPAGEVTYWTLFGGGDGETMKSMVGSVNDETNLQVNRQRVPFGEYYDRLYTSLTGGEAPDVAVMHSDRLAQYQDLVVPLSDHFSTDPYSDTIIDRVTLDGDLYGIPLDTHPLGLWYNKDIFEEAGLDPESPPESPSEFQETCEAIAQNTDHNVGQIHAGGLSMGFFHMCLRSQGTDILNDDYSQVAFNNEDGVGVAEFYDRMVNEDGWVPQSSDAGWNAWNNGEAGWLLDGTWHLSVVRGLDFDFGLAKPYMMPDSSDPVTSGNSHTLVIPRNPNRSSERQQRAIALIRLLTQEYNLPWGTEAGHLPASSSALESDELRNSQTWEDSLSTFYEMATNGKVAYMPKTENNNEWTPEIWQRLNAVRQNESEPQQAIEQAAQGVNQVL